MTVYRADSRPLVALVQVCSIFMIKNAKSRLEGDRSPAVYRQSTFFANGRQAGQRASGCGQRCRARQGSQTCELDLRRSAAIHQSVCRVTRLYAPLARSIITLTQFAAELVRRALQSIARCEVSPVDDAGSAAVLYVVSKCEGKWCRPTAGARTRMSCMDVGADALMQRSLEERRGLETQ